MENHKYSLLDMNGFEAAFQLVDKDRGKNAKQLTGVLLLKAHQAVGSIAWLGNDLWTLLGVQSEVCCSV